MAPERQPDCRWRLSCPTAPRRLPVALRPAERQPDCRSHQHCPTVSHPFPPPALGRWAALPFRSPMPAVERPAAPNRLERLPAPGSSRNRMSLLVLPRQTVTVMPAPVAPRSRPLVRLRPVLIGCRLRRRWHRRRHVRLAGRTEVDGSPGLYGAALLNSAENAADGLGRRRRSLLGRSTPGTLVAGRRETFWRLRRRHRTGARLWWWHHRSRRRFRRWRRCCRCRRRRRHGSLLRIGNHLLPERALELAPH